MQVSVVMCTYNGARFIRQQLASVLVQLLPGDELIVCDDASSDATASIIREFSLPPGVSFHFSSNSHRLGIARNFEGALALASKEVVFLADQDDIWSPLKRAQLVDMFDANPKAQVVFSDANLIDAQGAALEQTLLSTLRISVNDFANIISGVGAPFLKRNFCTGATMAVRQTFLKVGTPIPSGWLHDEWLATLGALSGTLVFLDRQTISYRLHAGNAVGVVPGSMLASARYALQRRRKAPTDHVSKVKALREKVQSHPDLFEQQYLPLIDSKYEFVTARHNSRSSWSRRLAFGSQPKRMRQYREFANGWKTWAVDLLVPEG
jgi:glycosyltransferase involved in cell wall biosynthesis